MKLRYTYTFFFLTCFVIAGFGQELYNHSKVNPFGEYEEELSAAIADFKEKSGFDVKVVTSYEYSESQLLEYKREWIQNSESKGLLVVLNPAEDNWEDNFKVGYGRDVTDSDQFTASGIQAVVTGVMIPLLEEKEVKITNDLGQEEKLQFGSALKYFKSIEVGLAEMLRRAPMQEVEIEFPNVEFVINGDQKYGFDLYEEDVPYGSYEQVTILGKNRYVPWKSVETGNIDKVNVSVEVIGDDINVDDIKYKTLTAPLSSVAGADDFTRTVNITGSFDDNVEQVQAFYSYPDEREEVLATVNVKTYDQERFKLVVVPVDGNSYPYNFDNLRTKLNETYNQAVIQWDITLNNLVQTDLDPGTTFDDGETGLLSNYTGDMKTVWRAFKDQYTKENDTYYLFLVRNPASGNKIGFMPKKRQYGFVFLDNINSEEQMIKTVAHELGHGAFRLSHPHTDFGHGDRATDNLMDYQDNGLALKKYQWDFIHDPENMLALFQDEDEGAQTQDSVLIVKYRGDEYENDEIISFPSGTNKKISLKGVFRNKKKVDKNLFQWIGVTSTNKEKSEMDLSTVTNSHELKLIYDVKDTITVKIVKHKVEFARDDQTHNRFGYDENGKPKWASSGHHISVKNGGNSTYALLNTTDLALFDIISEEPTLLTASVNPTPVTSDTYRVTITSTSTSSTLLKEMVKLKIRRKGITDTTSYAVLNVHLYKEILLNGDLYQIYDGRTMASAPSPISVSTTDIERKANEHLKSMVTNATLNNITIRNIAFDQNNNKKLEIYENAAFRSVENYEMHEVYNSLAGLSYSDALVTNFDVSKAYLISKTVNNTDSIFMPITQKLPSGKNYIIGKPNSISSGQKFTVKSVVPVFEKSLVVRLGSALANTWKAATVYKFGWANPEIIKYNIVQNALIGDTLIRVKSNGGLSKNTPYELKSGTGLSNEIVEIKDFVSNVGNVYLIELKSPLANDHYINADPNLQHYLFREDDHSFDIKLGAEAFQNTLNLKIDRSNNPEYIYDNIKNIDKSKTYFLEDVTSKKRESNINFASITESGKNYFCVIASKKLSNHPFISGNYVNSHHIVKDYGASTNLAGLSSNKRENTPAIIINPKVTIDYLGYLFSHEQGHGTGLADVNNTNNVMHFNANYIKSIYSIPYAYEIQQTVITGSSVPDGEEESQWDKAERR